MKDGFFLGLYKIKVFLLEQVKSNQALLASEKKELSASGMLMSSIIQKVEKNNNIKSGL